MLASVAAWPVQFNMRLLGLHIYASQVCTETALICRDEERLLRIAAHDWPVGMWAAMHA